MGWSLRKVVELLVILAECLYPFYHLVMNIVVWNCRGALKPNFQSHVRELARNHNPDILMVMKTRIGGVRAREIIDWLPFDGAIHTERLVFLGAFGFCGI